MITIEHLREFRIGPYAVFDFVVSFLGIYILAPLLSKLFMLLKIKVSRKSWIFLTIPLSILIHYLVNNITPMTEDFLNPNGSYFLKIVIILLTIIGLKDIKFVKKSK